MRKTIGDLRTALFAVMDGLADQKNPMDIDRAKAISEVAQTIINSAKVEVEFSKKMDFGPTRFFELDIEKENDKLPSGVTKINKHILHG